MHRSAVTNATILHHQDDVGLLYHCNAFVSLFSVSGLPSFKEHMFQVIPLSGRFQIRDMQYGKQYLSIQTMLMFRLSPNGKGMVYGPNGI